MINYIKFTNYKAFQSGEIELKPITVLLGANSVGKSAILQLFLMLQQTNKAASINYRSALKLYGGFINLGEVENIFRNKKLEDNLALTFKVSNKEIEEEFRINLFERFLSRFAELGYVLPVKKNKKSILSKLMLIESDDELDHDIGITKLKDTDYFKAYLDKLISGYKNFESEKKSGKDLIMYRNHFWHSSFYSTFFTPSLLTDEYKDEIMTTYLMLKQLTELITSPNFELHYQIAAYKDILYIKKVTLLHESIKVIQISCENFHTTRHFYKLDVNRFLKLKSGI